jgi:DNA-binding PadR family transcriptional regulator
MTTQPRIPELPEITHAQFFVLESLMVCPLRGKDLRAELHEFGWLKTNATFYQLTKRLEKLGLIAGFYTAKIVGDFAVRERHYEITIAGVRAYHAAHAFYSNGVAAIGS